MAFSNFLVNNKGINVVQTNLIEYYIIRIQKEELVS